MEHLSNSHLVHRDLAARNVLLTPAGDAKITSLSLCRDVYPEDYYPFNERLIPLRWMSPEAIFDDRYTSASDSWSYGVFVFEVFSYGGCCQPYAERTNEEILLGLSTVERNVLNRPHTCPEDLWRLVQQCLRPCPNDRPSFSDIELITGDVIVDSCLWGRKENNNYNMIIE